MYYISFDIGGTYTKYAIINDEYKILEKDAYLTNASLGKNHIIKNIINTINKTKYPLQGVAISSPGVIDYQNGIVLYANERMPDYIGLDFSKEIYKYTKLNCSVENDVNCFALSETLKNKDPFIMITIGSGIGGAIVINNQIYHGITNSAGEFGQMLINESKWEDLASMKSLVEKAKKLNININNGEELFDLYDKNKEKVIKIIDDFYYYLAIGICNLAYIFNPSKIIIGGGITKRVTFINELNEKINNIKDTNYFSNTSVEVSENMNDGGLIGALVHYKNIFKNGR
jgi:predicted NBD/HSP70 family sugar kinase